MIMPKEYLEKEEDTECGHIYLSLKMADCLLVGNGILEGDLSIYG